ncbi:MAG: MCP four helix bundle domain-containing protein [Burkholderiales bacterium]|uniref:methyl-accepting chemotaxis protein n=1 Tax=Inhella sp. TaxID=1921806 RepID=UPI001ACDB826|nr:MCP four helix bundle domain-containing protein [Burkholderiales bacterium]
MSNMSVATRLWMMVVLFAVVILVGSLVGLGGTRMGVQSTQQMYLERTVPSQLISEVEALLLDNLQQIAAALQTPKDEVIEQAQKSIAANGKKVYELLARFEQVPRSEDLEGHYQGFGKALATYRTEALVPAVEMLKTGDLQELKSIVVKKGRPLFAEVKNEIYSIHNAYQTEGRESFENAQKTYQRMLWAVIVAVGIALVGVVLYGRALVLSITQPLARAVSLAENVASGDLTSDVQASGRNELSRLMQALQGMNDSLAGIVQRVRSSADSIATGSAEIATGNVDLSQRTEQQAANLQRTAASMEELAATVRQNAESARQANEVAGQASGAAARGGEVVGRVVGTMQDISTSSRKIADIIGVIDGIAFQTNILALNAAVEAARAGESGRGFAVVAGEVRNLAGRSAEAAREIKQLIGQSVETIEAGSRQVQEAGRSMDDIVNQVQRVTSLISEISGASSEQTAGIEQVSQAVGELDQVTQANAALVEEAAAAAESLRTQAAQLVDTVGGFRLR